MREPEELAAVYWEAGREAPGEPSPAWTARVGEALAGVVLAAQRAWPDFDVTAEDFVRHLGRRAARQGGTECAEAPSVERAADLYLAFASFAGDLRARRALETILPTTVRRAVARIDRSEAFADAVAQELRVRLFMSDPPRIGDYAGRAALASWLRTAAVRTALNLRRGKSHKGEALPSGLVARDAPELELLRARYRGHFEDALREALGALAAKDRELLRLSVKDGLTIDDLAERYEIGRSTAARWLQAARERLTSETRRLLDERLKLTRSELDSVAAAVRSEIDVSVLRLLAE